MGTFFPHAVSFIFRLPLTHKHTHTHTHTPCMQAHSVWPKINPGPKVGFHKRNQIDVLDHGLTQTVQTSNSYLQTVQSNKLACSRHDGFEEVLTTFVTRPNHVDQISKNQGKLNVDGSSTYSSLRGGGGGRGGGTKFGKWKTGLVRDTHKARQLLSPAGSWEYPTVLSQN